MARCGVEIRGRDGHPVGLLAVGVLADGSVKWAGVAAVIPEEAEDIRFETILKKPKENRSGAKVRVDETTLFLQVSTGKVEAYSPNWVVACLSSLRYGGRRRRTSPPCRAPRRPSVATEGEAVLHFTGYRGQSGTRHGGTMPGMSGIGAGGRPLCGRCQQGGNGFRSPYAFFILCRGRTSQDSTYFFVFDGDMDHIFIRSGHPFRGSHARGRLQSSHSFRHGRWWGMGGTGAAFGGPSRVVVGWEKGLAGEADAWRTHTGL